MPVTHETAQIMQRAVNELREVNEQENLNREGFLFRLGRLVERAEEACGARMAELESEVETLKMQLPPVGSITFPPGCADYGTAQAIIEARRELGADELRREP